MMLESRTSLQNDHFPQVIVKPWRTHKSMRGPMYNLTSRMSNLPQRLQGKSVPLQARIGPEGSRKLKVPRFLDNGTGWW